MTAVVDFLVVVGAGSLLLLAVLGALAGAGVIVVSLLQWWVALRDLLRERRSGWGRWPS